MTLAANSYGSVAEVLALTRHLMDGAATFDATTRPTLTEVEKFIDRVSAILNTYLAAEGFAIPVTQSDAALALADWTVARAVMWVELTQRGAGYSDIEAGRTGGFMGIHKDARKFVMDNAAGWERLGATRTYAASTGLAFTAMKTHAERTDPDVTTREQPVFRRHKWDND